MVGYFCIFESNFSLSSWFLAISVGMFSLVIFESVTKVVSIGKFCELSECLVLQVVLNVKDTDVMLGDDVC